MDDSYFYLGRWPEITVSSDDHTIEASTTTGYDQQMPMAVVNDISSPSIATSHMPVVPYDDEAVEVTAEITDESPMYEVTLSYSINGGTSWTNVTMVPNSGNWIGSIPSMVADTTVIYKVFAVDIFENSAVSSTHSYTVEASPTTSTPTTSAGPITTPTTTSLTTTEPTGPPITGNEPPMTLILGAIVGGILVVVLVLVMIRKRR
ncbi:MAG: hypothetical protein ACFFER_14285 [Candidatus Thorarchaeota archaeon]